LLQTNYKKYASHPFLNGPIGKKKPQERGVLYGLLPMKNIHLKYKALSTMTIKIKMPQINLSHNELVN